MTIKEVLTTLPKRCSQIAIAGALSVGLLACGGGTDSATNDNLDDDTVLSKLSVGITDAEGDFLTYQVDVSNITLTRANGAIVNVLPQTTSINFAEYVEVTELLTVLDVPSGRYDSASMSLDFSNAEVTVQDENGAAIAASVIDEEGDTITEVDVEIMFNDQDGFVIAPGVPAQITLDFDLDASNDIDISGDTATVTVQPVLIADTILEEPKPFRLRGLLGSVDSDSAVFSMDLRPFRVRSGAFGSARVHIDSDTEFEIDGVSLDSDGGLAALSLKDSGTALITQGSWDRDAREYVATSVYAGSSVPWDQADIVRGTVVARNGNTLSVRGAIVQLSSGSFIFNDTFTVEISEDTVMTQRGEENPTIDAISVGSGVYATGVVTESTLDASEGIVRLVQSNVAGSVVSTSPLTVDIAYINGRRAGLYDFTGTGTSEATDADAANYEVNTGTLDVTGIVNSDPIRARGFTAGFGAAPEDFYANTLVDVADIRGHMVVNYGLIGAADGVSAIDEDGILLNIDDALFRHHIVFAGIPTDLTSLEQVPMVVPGGERGIYSIWVGGRLEVYTFYAEFSEALQADLDNDARIVRFDAHGYFDRGMGTFRTQRLGVILNNRSESE
ncbi:MAG: hypothetical protein K6L80_02700 [Agarilytica sp.]